VSALPQPLDSRGRFERDPIERDLIERIANALPEEIRADYYREMSHCRVLPESDEMLRILRAMQFLTVLIQQAPVQMAAERHKLAELLEKSFKTFKSTHDSMVGHQRDLEDRISELPDEISHGLAPGAIAERINNDIQKRFADLPDSVQSLASTSKALAQAVGEFNHSAALLTSSYRGVAEQARQAMDQMKTGIAQASTAAQGAAQHLTSAYSTARLWTASALCFAALITGFAVGMIFRETVLSPPTAPQTVSAPAPDSAAAAPADDSPARPKGKKKAAPGDARSRMQSMAEDQ